MDRKAVARETMRIMENGYYEIGKSNIQIKNQQERSVQDSFLLTPAQGEALLEKYPEISNMEHPNRPVSHVVHVWNCSTVAAIIKLFNEKTHDIAGLAPDEATLKNTKIAVLNFASAKNPGGGFLNGAMAQEESLAASSCLYQTLTAHEAYYQNNRACKSMMYTNHAIFSPEVVFFRNGKFNLLEKPVTASVLTLPAVNMGQVRLKGEDVSLAEQTMRTRMKLALAIFAQQGCRYLVLGAYGCGVFRNDPIKVASWWKELLDTCFPQYFESIVFAVLDRSANLSCIQPFLDIFEC